MEGLSWGDFLAPGAILLAAIPAWYVQRKIARGRATVDFISRHEIGNKRWQKAVSRFRKLTGHPRHPRPLMKLLDEPKTKRQFKDRILISSMLSQLEAVAVGLDRGVFSEKVYKTWNKTNVIRFWDTAESFIIERRNRSNQPTAFVQFERLAKKWKGPVG